MPLALAVLAFLDAYDRAAEKVRFPDEAALRQWAEKGDSHRKIVELISNRKHWARAFEKIEQRLGLFPREVDIRVSIEDTDDKRPACSAGKEGRGFVRFNMRRLAPFQEKLDEFERRRKAGETVKWVVPPMKLEAMIPHELTHIVAGGFEEAWLAEGIASYAAEDDVVFYLFNIRGSRVDTLDRVVPEEDAYARGMAFFLWLEKESGAEGVRAFSARVCRGGGKPPEAAAEVAKQPWDKLVLREKTWSAEFVAKFKNNP